LGVVSRAEVVWSAHKPAPSGMRQPGAAAGGGGQLGRVRGCVRGGGGARG
jgi:hypothetical protein